MGRAVAFLPQWTSNETCSIKIELLFLWDGCVGPKAGGPVVAGLARGNSGLPHSVHVAVSHLGAFPATDGGDLGVI